ncbi:MAG: trehalose-phosphatase [Candidatus Omnitrophota bacterium]|jgi:trehalose-phosphatase
MRYVFNDLENIKINLADKYLYLFLDYDGTLTPIAGTPDKAIIPQRTKRLLDLLSKKKNCRIAVISGRALADIKKRIGLKNVIYSGNHGFQIDGPKIKHGLPVSPAYKKALLRIKTQLKEKLSGTKGIFIEDKGFSLALHFRLVDKGELSFVKTIFRKSIVPYLIRNKIKIRPGKKVLEVMPPVDWDKGKVVLWLLTRQILAFKKKNIFPVYIGDDVTDEDAFRALKGKGLTIFVGKPGNSKADYYLKNAEEVVKFMRLIGDLKLN